MRGYVDHNGNVVPAFAEMMTVLATALGTKLTEARIRLFARLLSDVPADELRVAFRRAADERPSGFFPSPGELRRYVNGTEDDAALLAWAQLRRAAEDVGAYSSVVVGDGCAAVALEIVFGTWPAFCAEEDGPAMHSHRQEFLAAYRAARRHNHAEAIRLPGLCEASGRYALDGRSMVGYLTTGGDVVTQRDVGTRLLGSGTRLLGSQNEES